jgi:hypothetical protein
MHTSLFSASVSRGFCLESALRHFRALFQWGDRLYGDLEGVALTIEKSEAWRRRRLSSFPGALCKFVRQRVSDVLLVCSGFWRRF